MRGPRGSLRRRGALAVAVAAVSIASACGGASKTAESSTTSVAESSTVPATEVPTTVPAGPDLVSLGYVLQALLTTNQIGGGWIDQGRQLVPAGSNQLSGFLCAEGEQAVAALGSRMDPQVTTTFRRPQDVGLSMFETMMLSDREQVIAAFHEFVAAVKSCGGKTYTTADLGEVSFVVDPTPKLGTEAIAFRFAPSKPQTANPWLEQQMTVVLLADPVQPVAAVLGIGASIAHDPARGDSTALEESEYQRIVQLAVNRILEGE